jgi:membrane fusion protein, multidrug efflux system
MVLIGIKTRKRVSREYKKRKTMKKYVMTACAAGLAAVLMAGCNRGQQQAGFAMPPPLVTVTPAIAKDVPDYLDEIGTGTALQYVSIIPQVTGPVTEIHFTDGADVHKGDLLFTIDPRPYKAALDQAVANQEQSQAAVSFAKLQFQRYTDLLPTKAVSQDDYDTKKNALDLATAQLEGSNAAVETARLNLEYCTIDSPVDGRAGQHLVDIGTVVSQNSMSGSQGPLVVIQTLDPIYIDFTCAESDLPAVRQHAAEGDLKTLVTLPGDTDEGHEGKLTFIDTQVQNQSGTVKLRATLPNADHHFWPGQWVKVRLILKVEKNAVLIPATAQQTGQTGPYVYVVKDDMTAEQRPITLGQRQGDLMVVESGIKPGERVVTSGQYLVTPGGPVRLPAPAAPAAASPQASADAGANP